MECIEDQMGSKRVWTKALVNVVILTVALVVRMCTTLEGKHAF